jgi:cytoskeletal protein RodZ
MKVEEGILGLASIRRNRGISLEQISVRFLGAIESGDFRKLPGGIYNTNYIRQYARAIDYDETALLSFYDRQMAPAAGTAASGRKSALADLDTAATFLSS